MGKRRNKIEDVPTIIKKIDEYLNAAVTKDDPLFTELDIDDEPYEILDTSYGGWESEGGHL